MKKYLVILLVLVLLCCVGVGYAAAELIDESDEVEIEQIVRYGDPSVAKGIDINTRLTLRQHLFWEVEHSIGREDELETRYHFSSDREYEDIDFYYSGVYLYTEFDLDWDRNDESSPLYGVYRELYEKTPAGQEGEIIIRLNDYYDYYPLSLSISIPGLGFDWNKWYDEEEGEEWPYYRDVHEAFSNFFRIPVLENDYRSINIRKDEGGSVTGWGSGWAGASEGWDTYSMDTNSVVLSDRVYFTVNNRSQDNNEIIDFSQVPGGYGIYCLPFESQYGDVFNIDEQKTKTVAVGASLKTEQLEMVYPLREGQRVVFFTTDSLGRLLLFTTDGGLLELTVIDPETMETLQRLEISRGEDEAMYVIYPYEDFAALQLNNDRLALLSMSVSGEYSLEFIVEYDPTGELFWLDYDAAMDWNGEKLAVAYFKTPGSTENRYVPDYYLAVYDKSGMLFFGEYDSTLSSLEESIGTYRRGVYGMDNEPITVEWN